jgi:hypothetical protein
MTRSFTKFIIFFIIFTYTAVGELIGASWSCSKQEGPFEIWINELTYVENSQYQIEVGFIDASVAVSTQLIFVNIHGNIVFARNLSDCSSFQSQHYIKFVVCQGIFSNNNVVSAIGLDDVLSNQPYQLLSISPNDITITYSGMQSCQIPASQLVHLQELDYSIQLLGNSSVKSFFRGNDVFEGIDVYQLTWQGLLPQTFGLLNQGISQWGSFSEQITSGNAPCVLGENSTSICSTSCSVNPGGATGIQISYLPIISGSTESCLNVDQQVTSSVCEVSNPCTPCTNLVRDDIESDIDCGGGYLYSGNRSAQSMIDFVRGGQRFEFEGCPRCYIGRRCDDLLDCDVSNGLLCLSSSVTGGTNVNKSSCTPWWFLGATVFVDVDVFLIGIDIDQFNYNAVTKFQTILSAASSTDNQYRYFSQNVTLYNLSYETSISLGTQSRRLEQFTPSLSFVARLKSNTISDADNAVSTLKSVVKQTNFILSDSLRMYAPQFKSASISNPRVVIAEYVINQPVPPLLSSDSTTQSASTALSPTAIIGIVVASVCVVGAVSALLVYRRLHPLAPHVHTTPRTGFVASSIQESHGTDDSAKIEHPHARTTFRPIQAAMKS